MKLVPEMDRAGSTFSISFDGDRKGVLDGTETDNLYDRVTRKEMRRDFV